MVAWIWKYSTSNSHFCHLGEMWSTSHIYNSRAICDITLYYTVLWGGFHYVQNDGKFSGCNIYDINNFMFLYTGIIIFTILTYALCNRLATIMAKEVTRSTITRINTIVPLKLYCTFVRYRLFSYQFVATSAPHVTRNSADSVDPNGKKINKNLSPNSSVKKINIHI